jgi:hypothetical protein
VAVSKGGTGGTFTSVTDARAFGPTGIASRAGIGSGGLHTRASGSGNGRTSGAARGGKERTWISPASGNQTRGVGSLKRIGRVLAGTGSVTRAGNGNIFGWPAGVCPPTRPGTRLAVKKTATQTLARTVRLMVCFTRTMLLMLISISCCRPITDIRDQALGNQELGMRFAAASQNDPQSAIGG